MRIFLSVPNGPAAANRAMSYAGVATRVCYGTSRVRVLRPIFAFVRTCTHNGGYTRSGRVRLYDFQYGARDSWWPENEK